MEIYDCKKFYICIKWVMLKFIRYIKINRYMYIYVYL